MWSRVERKTKRVGKSDKEMEKKEEDEGEARRKRSEKGMHGEGE